MEEKLKVDLTQRKKEIDKLVMEAVNAMNSSEDESSAASEPEVKPKKKRKADSSEESDYKPTKSAKKRRTSSDSEDWKETKKKKAGGKAKFTGFTRPYKLSPDLAKLMGCAELPRHEVVKKVWAIIKEKNLYDPKNKQYAICDQALEKVIGVKR